jgi:hypoxanthine phosphoribosyltransferase
MTRRPARLSSVPCLLSQEVVAARVCSLALQVSQDYAGREPIVVGVLKGSWMFMADLVRHLAFPVLCDFVKLSSYGASTATSGTLRLDLDMSLPAEGRELLIVEDIIDTGLSVRWLLDHLQAKRPGGVRVCALLDKPSRRQVAVPLDYVGFTIPDRFVVGYGIDFGEWYRELPYVGYLPGEGGES